MLPSVQNQAQTGYQRGHEEQSSNARFHWLILSSKPFSLRDWITTPSLPSLAAVVPRNSTAGDEGWFILACDPKNSWHCSIAHNFRIVVLPRRRCKPIVASPPRAAAS
jgi:hypothetical protein